MAQHVVIGGWQEIINSILLQGGFEYKRAICDSIIIIIEENADAKEAGTQKSLLNTGIFKCNYLNHGSDEENYSLYNACMLNLFQDWPIFASSLRIVNTLSWPQEFYICQEGRDPEPPPHLNTSASSTTESSWSTPLSEQVNRYKSVG